MPGRKAHRRRRKPARRLPWVRLVLGGAILGAGIVVSIIRGPPLYPGLIWLAGAMFIAVMATCLVSKPRPDDDWFDHGGDSGWTPADGTSTHSGGDGGGDGGGGGGD